MARVLFLADAGPEVGGGHVMRCLALSGALMDRGAACAFAAGPAALKVLDAFGRAEIDRLPVGDVAAGDLAQEAARQAQAWSADTVVVDHYGLEAREEQLLRQAVKRIVAIDDLADRPHQCDLLIDPSLGRKGEDYAGLIPSGAKVLTGPRHALIRPDFAAARAASLKRRGSPAPPSRLLIAMGLGDFGGITARVVNAIQPLARRMEIEVVLGADAPSRRQLERAMGLRVVVDARDMAERMTWADIAIGAGGASVWERACLGLPSVLVILAENQRTQAFGMQDRGATLTIDAEASDFERRLTDAFGQLRDDPALQARLSQRSSAMCDGTGAPLVAEAVLA